MKATSRPRPTHLPAFVILLTVLLVPAGRAQEQPTEEPPQEQGAEAATETDQPPPCSSPEHRQFDFWIGAWEVRKPDGTVAGTNRIETLYDGCALRENWKGAGGSVGTSLNLYDAARGVWHQTWVDGRGGLLLLEGGLEGDAMVMRGRRPSREEPSTEVLHEIRWEPLDDGRVRQLWRASEDDGASWRVLFEGLYSTAP